MVADYSMGLQIQHKLVLNLVANLNFFYWRILDAWIESINTVKRSLELSKIKIGNQNIERCHGLASIHTIVCLLVIRNYPRRHALNDGEAQRTSGTNARPLPMDRTPLFSYRHRIKRDGYIRLGFVP